MSLFGEIKCGRCDRHYSGARSKCPYCGARKSRSGRRLDTTDGNAKVKVVAGLVILLLIVAAVVAVVLISVKNPASTPAVSPSADVPASPSSGIESVENTPLSSPSAAVTPEPSASPSPVVTDIVLNREDFTMFAVGGSWDLEPQLVPADADVTITFTSSDESVALVDLYGKVTAIGAGTATVTATAGGVTKTCIVRVHLG